MFRKYWEQVQEGHVRCIQEGDLDGAHRLWSWAAERTLIEQLGVWVPAKDEKISGEYFELYDDELGWVLPLPLF